MTAPSILLLDDGELDRVQELVASLSVDWMRCAEVDIEVALERPRDLLVTSGPRAMRMPALTGEGDPVWLCIYDQDFLPLRERLRDLGVHYLVSGELAPRTFEMFLRQLLYRGEERRQVRRIPLQCPIEIERGPKRAEGLLLELSRESCVFASDEPLASGESLCVRLPAELTGDWPLELPGRMIRCSRRPEPPHALAVLRFDELDADAMARIHHILTGHALGTQVTPLHEERSAGREAASWSLGDEHLSPGLSAGGGDRREAHRHHYGRRIEAVRWAGRDGLQAGLGIDLSATGVRVSGPPPPAVGSRVTLALYGRAREEPLLLGATVVRCDGEEAALRFDGLSPSQQGALERLLRSSPQIELIDSTPRPLHVAELLTRKRPEAARSEA